MISSWRIWIVVYFLLCAKWAQEHVQQVQCISDTFKHNLEFENRKPTGHQGLKDRITICTTKQRLPSGQGFLFILFAYRGVLQHGFTDQKGSLGKQLLGTIVSADTVAPALENRSKGWKVLLYHCYLRKPKRFPRGCLHWLLESLLKWYYLAMASTGTELLG